MTFLFDTSVLVSALLKGHQYHEKTATWLLAAHTREIDMFVSAHTIAELYATLTRIPKGVNVSPAQAWTLIETNILNHGKIRSLNARQYARLIKRLSSDGLIGGVVYDAVILEIARLNAMDGVLTLNESHFRRIWPEAAERILSPLTTPPATRNAH